MSKREQLLLTRNSFLEKELVSKNRELEIEASLEKVRARTMSMQKAAEFVEVIDVIGEQFIHLGFDFDWVNFSANGLDVSKAIDIWNFVVVPGLYQGATRLVIPFFEHPVFTKAEESVNEYYTTGNSFTVVLLDKKDKDTFLDHLFTNTIYKDLPDEAKISQYNREVYQTSNVVLKDTWLSLGKYDPKPLTDEQIAILKRLANEFGQSYTRFLDLQKAEAQAREAQIQLALERVRARTMAMQKSEELNDVAALLFQQVKELGIKTWTTGFNVWSDDNNFYTDYVTTPLGNVVKSYTIDTTKFSVFTDISDAKKRGEKFWVQYLEGGLLKETYKQLMSFENEEQYEKILQEGFQFPSHQYDHFVFGAKVSLMFITYESAPEAHHIFIRLGKVFDQTYTRFLDLQKAEAQAREAQIEAALESVRASSMAMHHSNELENVVKTLAVKLTELGLSLDGALIFFFDKKTRDIGLWIATNQLPDPIKVEIPNSKASQSNLIVQDLWTAFETGKGFINKSYSGKIKNDYFRFTVKNNQSKIPKTIRKFQQEAKSWTFSAVAGKNSLLGIDSWHEKFITEQDFQVLIRFSNAFEQAYTRFLDLQKAEAQAREAQIQLALERVRARTMAMQQSEELKEVVAVIYEQLLQLGFVQQGSCNINIMDANTGNIDWWMTGFGNHKYPHRFHVEYIDHPTHKTQLADWKRGKKYTTIEVAGESKKEFDKLMLSQPDFEKMSEETKMMIASLDKVIFSLAFMKYGALSWAANKLTYEQENIFQRFATVFEQTYTRFLDLQKAEAQAREAQIEAALEKIRSRSLAMQRTDELREVVAVLFVKLKELGLVFDGGAAIHLFDENSKNAVIWVASPDVQTPVRNSLPYDEAAFTNNPIILDVWKAKDTGIDILNRRYSFEEKNKYFEYVFKYNDETILPQWIRQFIRNAGSYTATFISEKNSLLGASSWTEQLLSEENVAVLRRIARVFEQAYTRFLDLQKAEAQAKEAKIEAALERIRAKAMAMHTTQDLSDTIGAFYHELQSFSLTPIRCGVGLLEKEERIGELYTWYTTEKGQSLELIGRLKMAGHPVLNKIYEGWLSQTEYHPVLRGNEIKRYYKILRPQMNFPDFGHDEVQFGYFFFFPEGGVYAWMEKEMQEDELRIYRRFTSVLSLTYKRYRDMQKAEANAKEAVKQSALDRIRADIASMRTTQDLERITPLIWNELTILGVPFIRCGVFIMDETQRLIHSFLSTPEGKAIAAFHLPYDAAGELSDVLVYWRKNEIFKDHWDKAKFTNWTKSLVEHGAITSEEKYSTAHPPVNLDLHFLPFLQGMLYIGSEVPLTNAEIQLAQTLANAFSTAYARYEDFNKLEAAKKQIEKTLSELKQAQAQLIQSEKMASLGELTAGIAHEIQNPLNFVNNFSEVNQEMIDELKNELATGNWQLANDIADDIKSNEEKINHHGKRADAIVKGMLQHSRKSSGQKEPTDINALADEYLRLSYHGLRAKDKSFNATIETDFDKSIGKINIIPQDIGRVFLNLFNNAFYACAERSRSAVNQQKNPNPVSYIPTVSVKTEKCDDKVYITVRDNGNGIPQKIIDKIFQPFFTTKPTGEGTGLGLSLSYDIVKAHGGEIKVESKEGEGTEFIIQIPINNPS